ncbi:MAG TPA: NfeD family protein [Clostridiales bacterium]|jgi:membrane protein implicated in regulation of membrane protease activity|nr:NfeD family protein [Clostridiales bacterium]
MTIFWTAAIIVFLIIEGVTLGLTSIWFAVGSLAALIGTALGASIWLQVVLFIVFSLITLWFARPLFKKYINSRSQPTNADRAIGASGIVTETIDNLSGTGTVVLNGKQWMARSVTGTVIEEGSLVTVERIEGVKLMVYPSKAESSPDKEEAGAGTVN